MRLGSFDPARFTALTFPASPLVRIVMPLVSTDYYRLPEALELIKERVPNEDPLDNLLDALHSGEVDAWILDEEFGGRHSVDANYWRSTTSLFGYSLETGQGHLHTGDPYVATRTVRGPVQIDKAGLDNLLPDPSRVTTSGGEHKCRQWLKEEIEADHRRRFEECRAEAIEQFGVSKNGFRRVWDATVPPEWKRGGAPKKSSQ